MKLKLAKWCSIIPLFFHALLIASDELYAEFLGNTTILCLSGLVLGPSIFVMPFLAVLGFVLSVILIFQKERKAIKFLVLSFVNIIISVQLVLAFVEELYSDNL